MVAEVALAFIVQDPMRGTADVALHLLNTLDTPPQSV